MATLIQARGLSKHYAGVNALDELDLEVQAGGPIGLVGPNGAGKTTLFSLLAGFLHPTSGSLRLFGQLPGHADLCGRFAILPQDAPFRKSTPVARQLAFFGRLQGLSRGQARQEATRVLEAVDISAVATQAPEHLSHGQFKRLAIAQTLIGQPELVLLDEPTAGLDPVAARAVRQMIRAQSSLCTFLVSSHNLDEIQDLCESVILLDKGRLLRHCRLDELVESDQYLTLTLARKAPATLAASLAAIPGFLAVEATSPGDPRVVIRYQAEDADRFQIQLLEALGRAGISVVNFSRGRNLADSVIDQVGSGRDNQ